MNAPLIFLFCSVVGSVVCYNVQRELPYNLGPNDPYAVEISPSLGYEPSQQLFWGNGGSNQVGGNGGLWSKITNKFPFLENIFGRMELPTEYGVPGVQQQYGVPNIPQQYSQQQVLPQFYRGQYVQQYQQQELLPSAQYRQQQFLPSAQYQQQQVLPSAQYQQQRLLPSAQYQQQRFLPSARDVGFTDDAVIVTPPQVPVFPQPAPQPVPVPIPAPAPVPVPIPAPAPVPVPAPEPSPGYSYNKPQYRLELPHK